MNIRYRVTLNQDQRDELGALLSGGRHASRKLKRAEILLAADAGVEEIAASVGVGGSTVGCHPVPRFFGPWTGCSPMPCRPPRS
jgi:hypothetical protein